VLKCLFVLPQIGDLRLGRVCSTDSAFFSNVDPRKQAQGAKPNS
jgi:hypothetical protein